MEKFIYCRLLKRGICIYKTFRKYDIFTYIIAYYNSQLFLPTCINKMWKKIFFSVFKNTIYWNRLRLELPQKMFLSCFYLKTGVVYYNVLTNVVINEDSAIQAYMSMSKVADISELYCTSIWKRGSFIEIIHCLVNFYWKWLNITMQVDVLFSCGETAIWA